MKCPACGSLDVGVKDSRPSPDNTVMRRRRLCVFGHRFTTYEAALPPEGCLALYLPNGDVRMIGPGDHARIGADLVGLFLKASDAKPLSRRPQRRRVQGPDPACGQYEIEPGRALSANIDLSVYETFEERKERLRLQRVGGVA